MRPISRRFAGLRRGGLWTKIAFPLWGKRVRVPLGLLGIVLSACAMLPDGGTPLPEARLHLRDIAPQGGEFRLPGQGAVRIPLIGLSPKPLDLALRCDGAVLLHGPDGLVASARSDAPMRFRLDPVSRGRLSLEASPRTGVCDLRVTAPGAQAYQIVLRREGQASPGLVRIDATPTRCAPRAGLDGLAGLFNAPRALSLTCPDDPGAITLQPEARAAFQAKVRALTGRAMPDSVLDGGDFDAPIDFSRAPRLELITLTYLHLRADFTGWMMARMLAFHASRGTPVRILVSDAVTTPKDRALLEHLAAQYPGIALQFYRAPGAGLGRVHRVNHVKLFAAVGQHPGHSVAMLGGRNLHDGFVFETPRDLGAAPFLHDYDPDARISLYFFNAYKDFDIAVQDDATVRRISADFARFWNRDPATGALAPALTSGAMPPPKASLRHFLSMPLHDGQALEQLYVDLFDRARDRIEMTSPFLNLPPRLTDALNKALARGVRVDLVTRIEMPDPSGFLATTLNKMFVRDFGARMRVWAHQADPRSLHAKYLIVDGELAVVTSTNLNRRSFAHDTENGVMILDRRVVARLRSEFDRLKSGSVRVGPEIAVSPLREWLISFPPLRGIF